ncbi:family 18 glycosyl hydrolase [Cercophora newfieldiana]|uniref:chitinase n=1 Tax=Cercophora newfieldiana TaxID=92897 RepID=A0AA39YSB9_9PEZI|nr:family 18 glycosyl hydrolase [Cercophora newfieldiana]
MMRSLILACLAVTASAAAHAQKARYIFYFDQYHTTILPNKTVTAGITHVITAFANSSLFTTDPVGEYVPFMDLALVRALFDPGTKVCMAIGGWGDTAGFSVGAANDTSRKLFAKNVATTVKKLGYDCVDVDWEYPGGNGNDYKQTPNSGKVFEIQTYPLLLAEIKKAIKCHSHELSIAVPGREADFIAYTAEQVPKIDKIVDFVNVMSYDLMNRRDNKTTHHTSLKGSLAAIEKYIELGFTPSKLNLGFAMYAKWFTTVPGQNCTEPIGCPTVALENPDGTDPGKSGALTLEAGNIAPAPPPATLKGTTDGTCGYGTGLRCLATDCCSQYGHCGNGNDYCGATCQPGYGRCDGFTVKGSFSKALANSQYDSDNGGQWYWDSDGIFWTWDTPEIIAKKFDEIVKPKELGGVFAWSLGEDSYDWSNFLALQAGVKRL